MRQQYVSSGHANLDAIADRRREEYPPVLSPAPCHGCAGPTGPGDFRVARWAYYFSKLPLLTVLSGLGGKGFVATAAVPHATYHWLCTSCSGRARSQRAKAGVLRFLGLFLALVGLIGVLAGLAALFAVPLSQRDTATVWAWSWVPPLLLAVGVLLALWARRFKLPGALGGLQVRPFVLESLFQSEPAKLDELRRDYPDLYGLGPTPVVGSAHPTNFR